MATLAMQKVGLWALLKSFFRGWLRRPLPASTGHLVDMPANERITKKSKKPSAAVRTMRYIVKHSYHAMQKRKRRGKAIKRNLSYVSSMILEDYGEILSRRERRRRSVFIPYYN